MPDLERFLGEFNLFIADKVDCLRAVDEIVTVLAEANACQSQAPINASICDRIHCEKRSDVPPLPKPRPLGRAVAQDSLEAFPATDYIASLDSEASRDAMRTKLTYIAHLMGYATLTSVPWSRLTVPVMTRIREHLLKYDRSSATVNQAIAAMKGVVRYAWGAGLVTDHVILTLRLVKKVRAVHEAAGRTLDEDECARIFESCEAEHSPVGLRDAAFFALGLGLGLRRTEILTAQIADLRESDRTLLVHGKGRRDRRLPIPDVVWKHLLAWLTVRGSNGSPYIITHAYPPTRGKALERYSATQLVRSRLKKAGIAYFSCHDLRRTYATALYEIDHDILTVKEGLGHASVTTTQNYIRHDGEALREQSERLTLGVKVKG